MNRLIENLVPVELYAVKSENRSKTACSIDTYMTVFWRFTMNKAVSKKYVYNKEKSKNEEWHLKILDPEYENLQRIGNGDQSQEICSHIPYVWNSNLGVKHIYNEVRRRLIHDKL